MMPAALALALDPISTLLLSLSALLAADVAGNEVPTWVIWVGGAAVVILVIAIVKKLVKTAIFFGLVAAIAFGAYLWNTGQIGS